MAIKTPEQKERDRVRNQAIRDAKDTVRSFFKAATFAALDATVKDALRTLAPTARRATNTMADELKNLFADKASLTELDIFKAMKVGPNEMKAKVNNCLKLAQPEDRMWISYDDEECIWTLEDTGAVMPEGYALDNLIPSLAERAERAELETMSFAAVIAEDKAAVIDEPAE